MKWLFWIAGCCAALDLALAQEAAPAQADSAGRLGQISAQLRENLLDAEACFEVRDFQFRRHEARIFLSDGYLIFRRPIDGRRMGALFVAKEEIGDAEILLIPPNRLERVSLNAFIGAPTLEEHFRLAAFLFSDGTGEAWFEQLSQDPTAKRRPERGAILAESWNSTVRNLGLSLETRLVEDLLNGAGKERGFFFATISGNKLGNFDLLLDASAREEVLVGQLVNEDGRSRYDFWTHYEPRRANARPLPEPAVKVRGYRVEARIDENLLFHAKVSMEIEARRGPLEVISIDLAPRLRLQSVQFNGQEAEHFQRDALRANLLRTGETEASLVRLPRALKGGESGTLTFDEEGQIFFKAGNGVLYLSTRTAWFPQAGWQPAPFAATFRHPKALTLVCPGQRSERLEGEEKVTSCEVTRPVRFFGFNLGDYVKNTAEKDGFAVELYANRQVEVALERSAPSIFVAPPPISPQQRRRIDIPPAILSQVPLPANPLARLPMMSAEIADAAAFFQGLFGAPPLTKLVAAPIPGAFGQGFPGFLYLSTLAFLEDRHLNADLRAEWQARHFRDLLQAHEVAHQWWGNWVTFESYRDEWLSEALANYSALLYLEKKKGPKAVETVLEEYKRRLLRPGADGKPLESAGPIVFGVRIRSSQPAAWQVITYEKGSWIMHMLRGRLGDEAFRSLLGELVKQFSEKPMTSEDLRKAAASHLPKGDPDPELRVFFDAWVYGTGVPTLELTSVNKGVGPRAQVTVTLKQSGVPENFEMDVPVEILLPRGKRVVRWVRSGKDPETIQISPGAVPLKVQIDTRFGVLRQ